MKMLNFGCGIRINNQWENIDFSPNTKNIKKVNLLEKLPYNDNSFDVAYSSHFLEHLDKNIAPKLLNEMKRILKKNGILRIVVPDLENIIKEYIKILDSTNESSKAYKHEWITIELLDQMTRMQMGGGMLEIFNKVKENNNVHYANYIKLRVGDDILSDKTDKIHTQITFKDKISMDKIKNKILQKYLKFIRILIPKSIRNEIFVNTSIGEKHKWMYDKYSLKNLLNSCGFRDVKILSYNESEIKDFNSFLLDINDDGSPYKGNSSIYIECRK